MKHFTNLRWLIMSLLLAVGASAWGQTTLLSEDFSSITSGNSTATSGSNSQWNGNTNFPTVSKAYQAGGAIKLGASGNPGSITSKSLTIAAGTLTVAFDVKGWTSVEGNIKITAGSQNKTITYTAKITSSFESKSVDFTIPDGGSMTVKIETTAKRAFIDNIVITNTPSGGNPTVATPTFSPAAGAVLAGTEVSINCTTEGATIHYTTNGSTPTTSSAIYSEPIVINSAQTLKAIAVKDDYDNSEVATAVYTITTPYTVAQARAAIDAGTGTTGVYVTGIVSEIVTPYNSQYGNISYNISADGLTSSAQLQAYRGKSYNGENFTSSDDIMAGDVVVIFGDLIKHGDTYELAQYNQLVSLTRVVKEAAGLEYNPTSITLSQGETLTQPTFSNPHSLPITYSSNNKSVATVASDGTITLGNATGTAIITAHSDATSAYYEGNATFTITVNAPANRLVTVDENGNVTFLFNNTGWGLPEGSANKIATATQYTNYGYTITVAGSLGEGYYYNPTQYYLLMGKEGAYLTLPAFDFDVDCIVVEGKGGASEVVKQNIFVGSNAVSTETTGATGTNNYDIAAEYQTTGNVYTLKVTSNHNTQITSIKVYKKSTTPSLSFTSATADVYVEETYTQTVNAYNTGSNAITYATSNAEIATVDVSTGEVTGVTAGTVTITASVMVDETLYTATYTLRVLPQATGSDTYTKVTSSTDLIEGEEYLLVYEGETAYALSVIKSFGSNVAGEKEEVTINGSTITITNEPVNVLTLGTYNGNYTFKTSIEDKYLTWTSGNTLNIANETSANASWTLTYTDESLVVKNVEDNTRILQYNSSNPRFACYANSNQQPVALYKKGSSTPYTVTIGSTGYATLYYGSSPLVIPEGVTAYTLHTKEVNGYTDVALGKTLSPGDKIAAGTGVILTGAQGEYLFPFDLSNVEKNDDDNILMGSDVATRFDESGYEYFVLGKKDGVVGFYHMTGTNGGKFVNNGAHKAFFRLPEGESILNDNTSSAAMRGGFSLDEMIATAIERHEQEVKKANVYYNLAGQRVMNPTKGIYIVNGKKVFIK